jgi:RNase P subunit RPR2
MSNPQQHRIAPPDGSREPQRINIFDRMMIANTQLAPLFPYFGEDAMVPAGAILRGEKDATYGQFFHTNSVDEVIIAFGAEGSLTDTGFVFVGANTHGVNSFLKNEEDPNSFLVVVITQHQRVGQEQNEAVTLRCVKCKEIVAQLAFDATPPAANHYVDPEGERAFPTLIHSAQAVEQYNEREASRTCKKCGTLNPRFPLERWGWAAYTLQSRTAADARRALVRAATATAK